jgi:hypothetical protein
VPAASSCRPEEGTILRANQILVTAAVVLAAVAAQPASAQGNWEYTVAPYLMGAAMNGTVGLKGHDVKLDVPFSKVLDNLHMGAMVHFDMKNDRWLVSSDLIYMNLQQSADVANGTAKATVTQTMLEGAGGYRVSKEFTVLAGARFVDLGNKLSFTGPHADWSGDRSKSWVDPFVGAQLNTALSDRWWLDLHGDVGGFSVGSKLAWQAYADVGYRASNLVSVYLGYRALDMDYETGSGATLFKYDVLSSGPQVGVAFRF